MTTKNYMISVGNITYNDETGDEDLENGRREQIPENVTSALKNLHKRNGFHCINKSLLMHETVEFQWVEEIWLDCLITIKLLFSKSDNRTTQKFRATASQLLIVGLKTFVRYIHICKTQMVFFAVIRFYKWLINYFTEGLFGSPFEFESLLIRHKENEADWIRCEINTMETYTLDDLRNERTLKILFRRTHHNSKR